MNCPKCTTGRLIIDRLDSTLVCYMCGYEYIDMVPANAALNVALKQSKKSRYK